MSSFKVGDEVFVLSRKYGTSKCVGPATIVNANSDNSYDWICTYGENNLKVVAVYESQIRKLTKLEKALK